MPELPEVESVARALRDSQPPLVGRLITGISVVWEGVVSKGSAPLDNRNMEECRLTSVSRQGKYLVFELMSLVGATRYLIIHLRMTGRLDLVASSTEVERHTRLMIHLEDGRSLRFTDPRKFGRVWLLEDPASVLSGLGPDALNIEGGLFAARLSGHHRQIKPLLLDQGCLAGIGNIYADESLFRAGIHPLRLSSSLSDEEIHWLYCAVTSVLEEAVSANGANIDGVFKAGSFIVSVYGREGAPCRVCGTAICKIRVGQRGTHFCRQCQKPPDSAK